jgi:2-polyprenyl-6-methoxyphenol hydroxylase-like FAD-dependent oxidoreductase
MTTREIPVLIVGGGPVGLALAAELGWRGVECLLVEQTDGVIRTPKMNEVNVRTMEFCRRWGIADEVLNCPFPSDHAMDIAFVTSLTGYELARQKRPAKRDHRPGPHSPMNLQICSQLWFDPILRNFALSFPAVEIAHRCRMESFHDTADGIEAEIHHLDDGRREHIRAHFLAACDGATSTIREARGIGLDGTEVLGRPVHMFFRAPDLLARCGMEQATFIMAMDDDGLWANIRIVDPVNGLWRLMVLDTPDGFDADNIDRDAYLERAVGRDVGVEIEWIGHSVWVRRGVVAESYRDGPVFLAGDSAHQLSPTGALGMNTGIGDAVDLGWKIAAVLDGWGGPGLLDSYDAERRAIGTRNVAMATEFHHGHTGFEGDAAITDDTPEGEALRARVGPALVRNIGRMFRTDGLQLGYRYDPSPIRIDDGTPDVADDPEAYVPSARPGARAPHVTLGDGRSTLDLFGRGFVLLNFADAADACALETAAASRGMPFETVAINDTEVASLYQRRLVLVRPDGHVAWRGDTVPGNPGATLDQVRGAG